MSPYSDTEDTRRAIIETCRAMNARGINQGTSGNVSVRVGDGLLITPSGVPYDAMTPDMIVPLSLRGDPPATGIKPSSEWRFHQALLAARPDMAVVVHAHPAHATAVAMQNRAIPACHYMVAAFGGADVPIVPYAAFGSDALARSMVAAMADRHGCLMANHGATVLGDSFERALWRIEELETLARTYLLSRIDGAPVILPDAEIARVVAQFAEYGPRR